MLTIKALKRLVDEMVDLDNFMLQCPKDVEDHHLERHREIVKLLEDNDILDEDGEFLETTLHGCAISMYFERKYC